MSIKAQYSDAYFPPAPVLPIRCAGPEEKPSSDSVLAIIDSGSDGTLVPITMLESIEAIPVGDAVLHGFMGETRVVDLFEIDLYIDDFVLPGILVASSDVGEEVILGRNVLNRLILLLDGINRETEFFDRKPSIHSKEKH
jgi:predicted aspartyl protease